MPRPRPMRVDSRKFIAFCKKLQRVFRPPTSLGKVIEGETLALLKGAARRTKKTTKARAGGKYNPGSRFFKGWVKMNGKKYYCGPTRQGLKGFRYSDAMWSQLQRRLAQNRERAETRVGLSKAVYYRVAADLSLRRYSSGWQDSEAIKRSYLQAGGMGSPAKSGPIWGTRRVATSSKNLRGNNPKLSFSITSSNSMNPFTGGSGAVSSAVAARERNFENAMKRDCFRTAKRTAGFFPNIKVER